MQEFKHELVLSMLDFIDQTSPNSVQESVVFMHRREGFRDAVSQLMDWEPASIRQLRERGVDFDEA